MKEKNDGSGERDEDIFVNKWINERFIIKETIKSKSWLKVFKEK